MNKVVIREADNYRIETVKKAVIDSFAELYGTSSENPLEGVICPGDRVFIKPNWVASRWRESCPHKDDLYCVITHPAVIEAVADCAAEALKGQGKIIIGDNPSIDADFEELMQFTGIRRLIGKYDVPCEIKDLRPLVCDNLKYYGQKNKMVKQSGDDAGSVQVNLRKDSLLYGLNPQNFRGVFNEREDTIKAHTGETQLYTYSKSLYEADVYISIPKLKTHQKVGATLNLKGLVGSIADKNQLVHWQVGYPEIHGDEYPDKASYEAAQNAKVTHRGAWPGNDTIWRMVVDLYKGMLLKKRKYISVIDGIVGGEGQGPFCPTSKFSNILIVGSDLLAADIAAVRLMGMNPRKIKYLNYFIDSGRIAEEDICVVMGTEIKKDFFISKTLYKNFYVVPLWEEIKYKFD